MTQNKKTVNLWVDGSYIKKFPAWAFLIEKDGKALCSFSGAVCCKSYYEHYQIAGEIFAVINGILYIQQYYPNYDINIYYDYTGLENWAKKNWKAKKPLTKYYQDFMTSRVSSISFFKIKAHSNNKFNDIVDQLSKEV